MNSSVVKHANSIATRIIGLSLAVVLLSFLIPVAQTVEHPTQAHLRTAIALLACLPFVGAGIWLLTSLGRFKSGLRAAYIMLGTGIILLSVGLAQLPVLGLFDLWTDNWATSAGVAIIFMAGAVLAYAGVRKLARLLHVGGWMTSWWLVTVLALVFAVISYIVSPSLVRVNVEGISAYLASIGLVIVYLIIMACLVTRVARMIGTSYRLAMRRLSLGAWAIVAASAHEYLETYVFYEGTLYVDYGYYLWPFVVMGFVMVFAAREFALVGEPPNDAVAPSAGLSDREYIDSIITIAALASRPADIDSILTELRAITARLDTDAVTLTQDDKKRLIAVYSSLENYLIQGQDPLRTFQRDELRRRLNQNFVAMLDGKN